MTAFLRSSRTDLSRSQIILIATVAVGLAIWVYMRSEINEYADRDVSLDSKEVHAVRMMMEQLQQSTNYLAACIFEGVSPMAR